MTSPEVSGHIFTRGPCAAQKCINGPMIVDNKVIGLSESEIKREGLLIMSEDRICL